MASWIKALRTAKNEIFRAAHDASAAADYLLALESEKALAERLEGIPDSVEAEQKKFELENAGLPDVPFPKTLSELLKDSFVDYAERKPARKTIESYREEAVYLHPDLLALPTRITPRVHPALLQPVVRKANRMKLTLDYTQRLNLHALLGAQRADVGCIRAIWTVQDRIALDADEEKAVELKREMVAGQERVVWNPARSIPAKEFEFTDPEVARIKAAVQMWDAYGVSADRRWLEPLSRPVFDAAEPI